MVGRVAHRERQGGVGAEHRAGRGEDEVGGLHRAAALEDAEEADDVGIDIGLGRFETVADPGLGGEVDDAARLVFGEQGGDALAVGQVERVMAIVRMFLQQGQTSLLQRRVVIGVEVVQADDRLAALQQPPGGVEADEAGRAGDEDGIVGHQAAIDV
ncbi:hypothetical protein D3C75_929190 [compost metagenome]